MKTEKIKLDQNKLEQKKVFTTREKQSVKGKGK